MDEEQRRIEDMYLLQAARMWRALFSFSGDPEIASDALAEAFARALRDRNELPQQWSRSRCSWPRERSFGKHSSRERPLRSKSRRHPSEPSRSPLHPFPAGPLVPTTRPRCSDRCSKLRTTISSRSYEVGDADGCPDPLSRLFRREAIRALVSAIVAETMAIRV